jgi:WD40 repeat protein
MRIAVTILVLGLTALSTASAQTPADVMKKATTAFAMLESEDGTVAAGLVVGNDATSLYIAGAAHMIPSCTGPFPDIKVSFDGIAAKKAAAVKQCDNTAGVDVVLLSVALDADTNAFLLRYDPELLASGVPPPESPVYSIGFSSFTPWFQGKGETMLSPEGTSLRFRSDAKEGQSGGGLFNDSWELVGTPLRVLDRTGIFSARPIQQLLDLLTNKWSVPVALKIRPASQRVVGADEMARRRAADSFGQQASQALLNNDVLGATAYVLEGRKYADTAALRNTALTIPAPALLLRYASIPDARNKGYTAIAISDAKNVIAVGAADGSVELLNINDGTVLRTLPALQVPISSLAFSDDGTQLVGGVRTTPNHNQLGIAIWRTDGSGPPAWIPVQNVFGGEVAGVQIVSPTRIAGLQGNSGMLFLVDSTGGTELWHQRKNVPAAQSLQRISDTEFFVRAQANHALVSVANDTFTTQPLPGCATNLGAPVQRVTYGRAVLTTANPATLIRGCDDQLTLSDTAGVSSRVGGHHTAPISQLALLGKTGAFLSGGWDGKVRIWNASGAELAETGLHRGGIRQIATGSDGRVIVALEQDGQRFDDGGGIRVWSYEPKNAVEVVDEQARPAGVPISPPQGMIPSALQARSTAECWRTDGSMRQMTAPNLPTARVTVAPDCSFGVIMTPDRVSMFRSSGGNSWSPSGDTPGNGITNGVLARRAPVVFWTEQSKLAGATEPQTRAYVWAPPASPIKIVDESGIVLNANISDDGKLVALSMLTNNGSQGPIRVWDWQANKQILKRDNPIGLPGDLAIENYGSMFFSTGVGIEQWNQTSSDSFARDVQFQIISHLYLSPDGSTLAVTASVPGGRSPRHLFLFDVGLRRLEAEMRLPRVPIDVQFSPEGRELRIEYQDGVQYFGVRKTDHPEIQQALTGDRLSDDGLISASP